MQDKPRTRTIRVPQKATRAFGFDIAERVVDDETGAQLYPVTMSSEYPVKRWSWDGPYYEILSHEPEDVDLSRAVEGLPAFKNHNDNVQVGSVAGIKLDTAARRTRGLLGFSSIRVAKDQKALVDEGHLRTTSVGYFILGMELVSTDEDGVPTYRVKWQPAELSLAPIPADPTVGVGRSDEEAMLAIRNVAADSLVEFTVADHVRDDRPAVQGGEGDMGKTVTREGGVVLGTGPSAPEAPAPREATRDFSKEAAEIVEICTSHGRGDEAAEHIRARRSPDQVARLVLDSMRTKGPAQPPAESLAGLPERDRRRYSYQRAVRILLKEENFDGLERELHDELSKHGNGAKNGGVCVPWRIRRPEDPVEFAIRTLGTGEATGGATLVDTTKGDLIDLLRSKTRVLEFGARFYPGLQGVVEFPKKTGAPTVYWMGENPAASVTQSEPTYKYVTMSPKTLIGQIQYPRQLMVQSSIDVEADLTNELGLGHAKAFDLAALFGLGSAKQPVGIWYAADVQAHPVGGVPDIADTGTMTGLVADADADYGALRWMTTPLMASLLRRTPVVSGYPKFLWEGPIKDGEVDGYGAGATTQVSKTLGAGSDEHGLIFGNWNELMLGVWGNDLELIVDEKSRAGYGQILITSFSMADVGLRHPEAFVKGTGAKLA